MRNQVRVTVLVLAFAATTLNADPIETPFKLHDHLVVVKGSINGHENLNLIIDTGATYTMISKQLNKKMNIKTSKAPVISWGKKV